MENESVAGCEPLAFDGCAGLLHRAGGDVGVLMCSPWGYEELCTRKSWRLMAETVAHAGYPCLRFDYPGCGDSLGGAVDIQGLESWVAVTAAAADVLKRCAGVSRLVLVGQGLGASIAALAAERIEGVEALALLAPVSRGRTYLRELAAWEAMIAGANGYERTAPADGSLSIAGFEMSIGLVEDIRGLDLLRWTPKAGRRILVLGRAGHSGDAALAERLQAQGATIETRPYAGFEDVVTDPTQSRAPFAAIASLTAWLAEQAPPAAAPLASTAVPEACLRGPDFVETAVRIGAHGRLHGVLCEPAEGPATAAAIILNSGYDPHVGWARAAVDHARGLAREGVATLRMDSANIGDSPARPGLPDQVLYADSQTDDVVEALDWLQARELGPVTLIGRCSGAYLGLISAVRDPRVERLVMINPLRLVWDAEESVDEALRYRSFSHYRAKALRPETLKRILAGRVDLGRLARRMVREGLESAAGAGRDKAAALQAEVERRFAVLRDRGVEVSIVFSDGEADGVERFARHFGKDGRGLAAYPNVEVSEIEGADHNLTPRPARQWLLRHVIERITGRRKAQSAAA